jgi:hypothetical protein
MCANRDSISNLERLFNRFAQVEAKGVSPLYFQLAREIAKDEEMLDLASHALLNQPPPNMLFGAVHFLLLRGANHPLSSFYSNLCESPAPTNGAFPHFRNFCRVFRKEVEQLLATRLLQTNEVSRCSSLLPGFAVVEQLSDKQPWFMVDIGASAGLNLIWDRYSYDYGQESWGPVGSGLKLFCKVRGGNKVPLPSASIRIDARKGIDLHPLNLDEFDDRLWLRALIWPEQSDRAIRLEEAMESFRRNPIQLIAGDVADQLPELLDKASPRLAICLFSSFTLNQISQAGRDHLAAFLTEYSRIRNISVFFLALGYVNTQDVELRLSIYEKGSTREERLARCAPHGGWIEWLGHA